MLRRRLPIVLIIVVGIFLGIAIAGVPSSSESPPVSTFVVMKNGKAVPSVDPKIGQ